MWKADEVATTADGATSAYPSFCFTEKGSLSSIAVDMFHNSSAPGIRKFQRVLDLNPSFHVNLPQEIFQSNRESLTSMFRGYGLVEYKGDTRKVNCSNITSVENLVKTTSPRCPIGNPEFVNSGRIIIQTEQYLDGPRMRSCHESPNCVIIEFSDYNYRQIQKHGWGDSTVLLPTMHQHPSRLVVQGQNTSLLVPLKNRSTDACFFGSITRRRKKKLVEPKDKFLEEHPNRTIILQRSSELQNMSSVYGNSKICLVAHSWRAKSGGEYHRLSEFAPFGCLPVMEEFLDEIGMDRYTKCGRVTFTKFDELFDTVEDVLHSLDDAGRIGPGDEFSHVQWWNKGIQWETLLQTVLKQ